MLALAAVGAHAQGSVTGISESTDPARIAAVEALARDIQARERSGIAALSPGQVRATTRLGWEYVSGGVATEGRDSMMAERDRYSLWVATVARPSGAYLADVTLRIEDTNDRSVVLDTRMSGPWLMIRLPPGRYDIVGTYSADRDAPPQTLAAQVGITAGAHRQAVLRFDSPAEVGSEAGRVSSGNPFGPSATPH